MAAQITRRDWLTLASAGVLGASASGWFEALAQQTANDPQRRRSCILLWMNGGPSQIDTFDPKPNHANGGGVAAIDTAVPGIRISENLPKLAREMRDVAIIRAMNTREADHGRATYHMRTGYLPQGAIQYPTLGSLVASELGQSDHPLPNFVSIAPMRVFNPAAFMSGFLGPNYAPMIIGESSQPFVPQAQADDSARVRDLLRVPDMDRPESVQPTHFDSRVDLLSQMQRDFSQRHSSLAARSHASAYDRAVRLMRTSANEAFRIEQETAPLRQAYGQSLFGQGCLLARRLIERGVPFVEVNLGAIAGVPQGWDTHGQNRNATRQLCEVLDSGFATLLSDLRTRGLLETTLVVWMGEFGRTPQLNPGGGRDHYINAWSTVLAGGGVRGGTVYGGTSADGRTVEGADPVSVPNFLATVCRALGVDPAKQNLSNVGRPIRITDNGTPVAAVLR